MGYHIQGCPRECTAGDIILFFNEWKPIDIIFKQINANAFVLFATLSDCAGALQKDRVSMGKRYIVVKSASRLEYYEAAAARLGGERSQPSHGYAVVKMRGLPFNVTYEDIMTFFAGMCCVCCVCAVDSTFSWYDTCSHAPMSVFALISVLFMNTLSFLHHAYILI